LLESLWVAILSETFWKSLAALSGKIALLFRTTAIELLKVAILNQRLNITREDRIAFIEMFLETPWIKESKIRVF